ncbi:hypothetical protein C0J52_00090 [Blattella germanica]|nr:hypothetical protein C0J52_00090 [Blattella germanica]
MNLIIFGGYIDPTIQFRASLVARQLGLIDNATVVNVEDDEKAMASLIANGENVAADVRWISGVTKTISNSKYENLNNAQNPSYYEVGAPSELFVSMPAIKQALHVGNATFYTFTTSPVRNAMRADFMNSAKQTLEDVLPNRKVLFVNGNMDLLLPAVFLDEMLSSIEPAYNASVRTLFKQDEQVVGYIKKGDNLVSAVLRNCGHYLPIDCSRPAKEVVKQFVTDTL